MRTRFVIPAALLVTVAYVKGRLDSNLLRQEETEHAYPVATPPVDPILRAQAEAEDAMVIAEAQAAAAGTVEERPAAPDPTHLSEWLTTPTWRPVTTRSRPRDEFDPARLAEWATDPGPAPRRPHPRPGFDPARIAEWMTDPAPRPPRPVHDHIDSATLAEWVVDPTWGPVRRTRADDARDAAALVEWASDPTWGEIRRARTRDAFEAAALAEWVAHVAPTAPHVAETAPEAPAEPDPEAPVEAGPEAHVEAEAEAEVAVEPSPEPQAEREAEVEPDPVPAPEVEVRIEEDGRFSLGGWAAQPGHMVLSGVTFRDRRDRPVDAGAIRLLAEAVTNVGEGGLVVLSDPGFAPDREGFTILLAAEGSGSFAAAGRYEVVAA